jgi:hypothetical protein
LLAIFKRKYVRHPHPGISRATTMFGGRVARKHRLPMRLVIRLDILIILASLAESVDAR